MGLALCRLEMMTDVVITADSQSQFKEGDEFSLKWESGEEERGSEGEQEIGIKAFVPDWIRTQIKVRKQQLRVE